jgi:hypothetical protein
MTTINISAELQGKIAALVNEGKTFQETLEQVIKLGCYQLEYRRDRNKTQAAEFKAFREWKKQQQGK